MIAIFNQVFIWLKDIFWLEMAQENCKLVRHCVKNINISYFYLFTFQLRNVPGPKICIPLSKVQWATVVHMVEWSFGDWKVPGLNPDSAANLSKCP